MTEEFSDYKARLMMHLHLYCGEALTAMQTNLDDVKRMVSRMMKAFDLTHSPEERELIMFAKEHGGIETVRNNGSLIDHMLTMTKDNSLLTLTREEAEQDCKRDIDELLRTGQETFDKKFALMKESVDRTQAIIRHESDRVIDTILKAGQGPEEGIIDQVSLSSLGYSFTVHNRFSGCLRCLERERESHFSLTAGQIALK